MMTRLAGAITLVTCLACGNEPPAFDDRLPEQSHPAVVVAPGRGVADSSSALIPVEISAYCLTGRTARGGWARQGIVAADKSVFPLGGYIELWIGEKYSGRYLVDDTGPAIKGKRIDLWMPDCERARSFGMRTGAAVRSTPR